MKKCLLIFCFTSFSILHGYAQGEKSLKGEFFLAPDFGLMLGTINRIEFSPVLGYNITDRFSIAAGFKYEFYSKTRLYNYQERVKTHIYGPRAFVRYTLFKNLNDFLPISMNTGLFAHLESESSSLERRLFDYPSFPENGRFWYSTLLVGGGISQYASERIMLNVLVLWDTDGGYTSLHSNPIIRFGFQFYLRPKTEDSNW